MIYGLLTDALSSTRLFTTGGGACTRSEWQASLKKVAYWRGAGADFLFLFSFFSFIFCSFALADGWDARSDARSAEIPVGAEFKSKK